MLASGNFHFQNEKCFVVVFVFKSDIVRSNCVSVNQTRNNGRHDLVIQSEIAEMEMRHFFSDFVLVHENNSVLGEIASIRWFDGIFRLVRFDEKIRFFENALI